MPHLGAQNYFTILQHRHHTTPDKSVPGTCDVFLLIIQGDVKIVHILYKENMFVAEVCHLINSELVLACVS